MPNSINIDVDDVCYLAINHIVTKTSPRDGNRWGIRDKEENEKGEIMILGRRHKIDGIIKIQCLRWITFA